MHSGYVFLPVNINDDGTTSIIDTPKLEVWLHFRSLSISQFDSILQNTDPMFTTLQLIVASMGLVAIDFDMTGYGEASSLVPSPLDRKSVVTASLPIHQSVKRLIHEETNGNTMLAHEAYFYG